MAQFISVIMRARDVGKIIDESVACLQSQTHRFWQLIIIEDGSTDDTLPYAKIAELVDHRILVISCANIGVSEARNRALEVAGGEWFLFLDPGAVIATDFMEKMLVAGEFADVVICRHAVKLSSLDATLQPQKLFASPSIRETLMEGCDFPIHASLINAHIIEQAGKFDPALRSCADWDFWLRAIKSTTRVSALNEVLAFTAAETGGSDERLSDIFDDRNEIIRRQIEGRYGPEIAAWRREYGAEKSYTWNLIWIAANGAARGMYLSELLKRKLPIVEPKRGDQWHIEALLEGLRAGSPGPTYSISHAYRTAQNLLDDFLDAFGEMLKNPELADKIRFDFYSRLYVRVVLLQPLHTRSVSFVRLSDLFFGRALPGSTKTLYVQTRIDERPCLSEAIHLDRKPSRLYALSAAANAILPILKRSFSTSVKGKILIVILSALDRSLYRRLFWGYRHNAARE